MMNKHALELFRYGVNGIVATAVHYAVLTFSLLVLSIESAGWSNFIAALFGITTSFIGSRYFVFPKTGEFFIKQSVKFGALYGTFAVMHGLVLFLWTDRWGYDFRQGFVLATSFQVLLSYLGNKLFVFKV